MFPEDQFAVGDFVKISSDLETVRGLQVGHGEWVDSMATVSRRKKSSNM